MEREAEQPLFEAEAESREKYILLMCKQREKVNVTRRNRKREGPGILFLLVAIGLLMLFFEIWIRYDHLMQHGYFYMFLSIAVVTAAYFAAGAVVENRAMRRIQRDNESIEKIRFFPERMQIEYRHASPQVILSYKDLDVLELPQLYCFFDERRRAFAINKEQFPLGVQKELTAILIRQCGRRYCAILVDGMTLGQEFS